MLSRAKAALGSIGVDDARLLSGSRLSRDLMQLQPLGRRTAPTEPQHRDARPSPFPRSTPSDLCRSAKLGWASEFRYYRRGR